MARIIGDADELITAVRHMAGSDARQIRREAEAEAEKIRNTTREAADRRRESILGEAREKESEIRRTRRAEAARREREDRLRDRQAVLDEIWERAEKRLRDLTGEEEAYEECLRRLTLAGVEVLGPGEHTVAACAKGHPKLTEERLSQWAGTASERTGGEVSLTAAQEPLSEAWGGLVIRDASGRRRVDLTFPARLRRAREEMVEQVMDRLVRP